MTVRVKGETYQDAAELVDTIGRLSAQALEMADGPERLSLAAHIEELDSALRGYANGEGRTGGVAGQSHKGLREAATSSTKNGEPSDDEIAAQEGAEFTCPMCGGTGELPHEPPADPRAERCPDCEGWGKVYTGSLVDGHTVRDCPTCQGQGWVDRTAKEVAPPDVNRTAADVPEQLGALWDAEHKYWLPPAGQQPPWPGATWDTYYGKWA